MEIVAPRPDQRSWLIPLLETMLAQFPLSFAAFIPTMAASSSTTLSRGCWASLLIEQTKSRRIVPGTTD